MAADLRRLGNQIELRPARRGIGRSVLVGFIALVLVGAAVLARVGDDGDPVTLPLAEHAESGTQDVQEAVVEPDGPVQLVLGSVGPVLLHVPGVDPVVVSFHEASLPEALPVAPAGEVGLNENATRSIPAGATDADGAPYHVQVSRGRANGPTSAIDVVLDDETPVLAPVAGTVTDVREYLLYGQYPDVRLELRPDGAPEHVVVMIHVEGVQVVEGEHVEVGDVLADNARLFPFDAVVDRLYAPSRYGHVHLEVKPAE